MEEEFQEETDAISETEYLNSIPGMKESLLAGLMTPLEECADEPGW